MLQWRAGGAHCLVFGGRSGAYILYTIINMLKCLISICYWLLRGFKGLPQGQCQRLCLILVRTDSLILEICLVNVKATISNFNVKLSLFCFNLLVYTAPMPDEKGRLFYGAVGCCPSSRRGGGGMDETHFSIGSWCLSIRGLGGVLCCTMIVLLDRQTSRHSRVYIFNWSLLFLYANLTWIPNIGILNKY